jgi:flagellar motor switch protein FliN/FliY
VAPTADPFAAAPLPSMVARVSYIDGVIGANYFVMPPAVGRSIVAVMLGTDDAADGEMTELELSGIGEVMNQLMAELASDAGTAAGVEIGITPPELSLVADEEDFRRLERSSEHVLEVRIDLFGEHCRLVQFVPHGLLIRIARNLGVEHLAMDREEPAATTAPAAAHEDAPSAPQLGALRQTTVRVWAEFGRARMPIQRAIDRARGDVIRLRGKRGEPVTVFANGQPIAEGSVVIGRTGRWAVQIERVLGP